MCKFNYSLSYSVEKALSDARLEKSDISEVVLVGGSTRIPAIKRLVEDLTNKKPNQSVNPDESCNRCSNSSGYFSR
jgi:molecular chaperone DnaK